MPVTARRSVLSNPSTRASLTGWLWRKSLPAIGKLAGWSRYSKLVGKFWRSLLTWTLSYSQAITATTTAKIASWNAHVRTRTSR